ncbi:FadR family transcriptional regulator [Amycolatopsis acidiphila]|uniref:FadR family transcriptional regulator n=1 Tax=Amycolatopsis acidiphila TaxID=715473 RepID=A0A557ZSQ6_9PSEU|nr:FadR/GntR family transcriptional regulator [Amycolatopsis acidiphila]TVT15073.1 FadR family transcriptional regulator [Amycolatopsis acidiphila]UIJ56826.1 FadR family transcriptional regulator [Amycolatopsis acidiphila]
MRVTRGQELVDSILELIDRRRLRAGDPLPPEPRLMEEFGVARNSVREALRTLQALGIVEIRHGYGTFVGDASMAALSPSLLFRTRARSRQDLRGLSDLLEVRQILETELTRKVVGNGQLLAALGECVDRMADPATASVADRRFHELIGEAAGNELALELIRLFWDVYRQTESLIGTPTSRPDGLEAKHRRIVEAIATSDGAAVGEAVSEHFDEIRKRIAAG